MPTPVQWLKKLEDQIVQQDRYGRPFEQRYANEYVLPFIAQEYREVYGTRVDGILSNTLDSPRTGTGGIVVDALVERLTITGGTSDDEATNTALTEAWEDNDLDVMHREAHREAVLKARSIGMVSRSTDGRAIGTIESADQCAVHRMSAPPYDVDAFIKVQVDEWTGKRIGTLMLATAVGGRTEYDLVEGDTPLVEEASGLATRWQLSEPRTVAERIPVVEFAHRPRLTKNPSSELERIVTEIDIVDLIEGLMVFAGHFGAVPIRYAEGFEVPRDPKDPTKPLLGPDGKPLVGFNPRADHMWFGGKGVKFGQLTPAGLESFVSWANHAVGVIRRQTAIASTYFTLDLKSHMNAELLKTDEAPMVRRINGMGRNGVFNQSWRQYLTLMMQLEGHRGRVKPLWADPQTRMEAQSVDSFQKAVAAGLGVRVAAEQFLGWDPDLVKKAVDEAESAKERAALLEADPIQQTIDKLLSGT